MEVVTSQALQASNTNVQTLVLGAGQTVDNKENISMKKAFTVEAKSVENGAAENNYDSIMN